MKQGLPSRPGVCYGSVHRDHIAEEDVKVSFFPSTFGFLLFVIGDRHRMPKLPGCLGVSGCQRDIHGQDPVRADGCCLLPTQLGGHPWSCCCCPGGAMAWGARCCSAPGGACGRGAIAPWYLVQFLAPGEVSPRVEAEVGCCRVAEVDPLFANKDEALRRRHCVLFPSALPTPRCPCRRGGAPRVRAAVGAVHGSLRPVSLCRGRGFAGRSAASRPARCPRLPVPASGPIRRRVPRPCRGRADRRCHVVRDGHPRDRSPRARSSARGGRCRGAPLPARTPLPRCRRRRALPVRAPARPRGRRQPRRSGPGGAVVPAAAALRLRGGSPGPAPLPPPPSRRRPRGAVAEGEPERGHVKEQPDDRGHENERQRPAAAAEQLPQPVHPPREPPGRVRAALPGGGRRSPLPCPAQRNARGASAPAPAARRSLPAWQPPPPPAGPRARGIALRSPVRCAQPEGKGGKGAAGQCSPSPHPAQPRAVTQHLRTEGNYCRSLPGQLSAGLLPSAPSRLLTAFAELFRTCCYAWCHRNAPSLP